MSMILARWRRRAPVPLPDLPARSRDDRDHPDVQRIRSPPRRATRHPAADHTAGQPPAASTVQAPASAPNQPASSPAPLLPGLSGRRGPSPGGPATPAATPPAAATPPPLHRRPARRRRSRHPTAAGKGARSKARRRGPGSGGRSSGAGVSLHRWRDPGPADGRHLVDLDTGSASWVQRAPELCSPTWLDARQPWGNPARLSFAIGSVTVAGRSCRSGRRGPAECEVGERSLSSPGLRLEVRVSAGDARGATFALVVQVRTRRRCRSRPGHAAGRGRSSTRCSTRLAAAPMAGRLAAVVNALLATGTTRRCGAPRAGRRRRPHRNVGWPTCRCRYRRRSIRGSPAGLHASFRRRSGTAPR